MLKIVGVIFNDKGKNYFFSCNNIELSKDNYVIVETERGLQYGQVVIPPYDVDDSDIGFPLKDVIRIATKNDIKQYEKNKKDATQALLKSRKLVEELKLNMRIIDASYTFDRKQLLFNFLADSRIDFRELAKKLAQIYKTRIELRQIGVRDKAKEIGGIGPCGRFLCCSTFLTDFNSVSINMAKNQMLAINIEKISGACGRLMCCLKYEDEIYSLEKERFPKIGSHVKYQDKDVKVTGLNVINDLVKIETNNGIVFVGLDEIKFDKNNHAGKKNGKPRSH